MKIAILGNNKDSFVRPMAEGLQRMLSEIGVASDVFYDGHDCLKSIPAGFRQYLSDSRGSSLPQNTLRYFLKEVPRFRSFLQRLRPYDLIAIVNSVVEAYLKTFFRDDVLRRCLPRKPVVLYDVFYLPTRGPWGQWLKEGNPTQGIPEGGNWGMERYDWYLCASVVSEVPLPKGRQPYSLIGLNLNDESLRVEPKDEFVALIDFEHTPDMHERAIQVLACQETNTTYRVLHGRYSLTEIRQIYRSCSIYFVAMRESFGLPICELQASGAYVFTPYSKWCPAHWLKEDLSQEGPGDLSPNFIVYDNDKETLKREIQRIKANYDPHKVANTFHQYYPQLFFGDKVELKKFIRMVEEGEIHSQSHKEYAGIIAPKYSVPFG